MYMQSSLPPRRLFRKTRLRLRLLRRRLRFRFLLRRLRTLRLRLRLLRLRRLLRIIRLYQRGRRETASAKSTEVRQPVNLQSESPSQSYKLLLSFKNSLLVREMRETLRFRKMFSVYAGNMPPLFLRRRSETFSAKSVELKQPINEVKMASKTVTRSIEIRDNVISQVYSTRCHGFELDCKLN